MTGRRLTDLSFEDWLEHVFGHEVPFNGQPWYFEPDCDWWDTKASQAVSYVTRLFHQPERLLESFADSQIAQGLWYLLNDVDGGMRLTDGSVALAIRTEAVRAMTAVFERIFDGRCAEVLSHLDEPGARELNGICYMWWDILPIGAAAKPARPDEVHEACLGTMRGILKLSNPACQESALHGLGHWATAYPEFTQRTIDTYLAANPNLRSELKSYALAARSGCIQ